jgi:hypothetical protein
LFSFFHAGSLSALTLTSSSDSIKNIYLFICATIL